jgi:TAG lipase/lysophosphatidylethanolamine acyltransferase
MDELGFLPEWMKGFTDTKLTGNVTIYPDIAFTDYHILFSNPTSSTLDHWMLKGEQATWPLLALIKNRCAIELALDRNLFSLRATQPKHQFDQQ